MLGTGLLPLAAACGSDTPEPAGGPIPGFGLEGTLAQRALEARFLDVLDSDSTRERARGNARSLTREPHLAGTDGAARTAEWLVAKLEGLGFDVEVDRYEPWLPHPLESRVEVLEPGPVRVLPDREPVPPTAAPAVAADAPELLAWHAYAGDGAAEGEVVYVNRGLPRDYATLDSLGVEVTGRIVLARLGGAYRGVKVHEAERRGALGVLLFPDPAGDGRVAGDTLPGGPYRPSRSVQRGTVMYMWRHTGDPATPGAPARGSVGAVPPRPAEADNLPTIPVAPIDSHEAGLLLAALEGPDPPERFRGGHDASYTPGPGPLRVRMEMRQAWARRPVRNVVARLPGRTDAEVILGNHFDAWVLGGVDAHSGTVALLEIAEGLARLSASGWRPRRGVTLAFWDAEEFGVVGSTEWVEDHLERLRDRAVAYLNVDVFTAGTLAVQGSPALRDLVVSAAEDVPDPVTGRSLAALWGERFEDSGPRVGDIGSGSDWTAFLHHAGVPSLQWTMNGRGTYAVYHSAYDDLHYLERWADSAFVHTPAFAGAMGLAALRLAEAEALPFRHTAYADRVEEHMTALEERHGIRLGPEREALEAFREAADAVEARQRAALEAEDRDSTALAVMDGAVRRVEQAFLDPAGLPGRPWYRHVLSAPGRSTGYAALPLPAVAEALESGDEGALETARVQLGRALERATEVLRATFARSPS